MNEITKIHLGRQAFTISVDAYKALQDYLHDIGRHAGGKDVVEEVEMRMAELLVERGITGDKVVLNEDVKYLKEQLGEPGDFSDEESAASTEDKDAPKRLFRDPSHGAIAGVCAGLAKYLGIDVVIIRIIFIVLTFAGASSILLYIILWLVVPEVKTSSERLQMQGKHVTVDTLKDVVERADVKGAAKRASGIVGKVVQPILKVLLGAIGISLMLGAIGALLGLTTASIYWTLNRDIVPENIFPVGGGEVALIFIWVLFAAVISLFLLFGGLAMVKRKWILPGWALGALVAVALASLAVGSAYTADAVPKVRQRYEAAQHTYVRDVASFNRLKIVGSVDVGIVYKESAETQVSVRYWGKIDLTKLKTSVKDGILTVDARELGKENQCQKLCVFHSPILEVTIQGPKLKQGIINTEGSSFVLPPIQNQSLTLRAENSLSQIRLPEIVADRTILKSHADGTWELSFEGNYRNPYSPQDFFTAGKDATLLNARDVVIDFDEPCSLTYDGGKFYIDSNFRQLVVNDKLFKSLVEVKAAQGGTPSFYNCVYVDPSLYQQLVGDDQTEAAENDSLNQP
jgi:phage shock protein PspC (stress-responsive transcriptional regulator)